MLEFHHSVSRATIKHIHTQSRPAIHLHSTKAPDGDFIFYLNKLMEYIFIKCTE